MEECEGGRGDGGLGACRVTAGMVKNYDDDEASLDCCGKTHAHNATYADKAIEDEVAGKLDEETADSRYAPQSVAGEVSALDAYVDATFATQWQLAQAITGNSAEVTDALVSSLVTSGAQTRPVLDGRYMSKAFTNLDVSDLDTIKTPGMYQQYTKEKATLARHYPGEGSNGSLEVLRLYPTSSPMQRFTTFGVTPRVWVRWDTGTSWTGWKAFVTEGEVSAIAASGTAAAVSSAQRPDPDGFYAPAGVRLTTPTHDGSGQAVHPSVLHIPAGFGGYTYWMAMTPLPGGTDPHEDPNILASNDGTTWVVPAGLTNPLDDAPGNPQYNSDTHLAMGPNNTLWCFWRWTDRGSDPKREIIYARTSTDGVTWTPRQTILDVSSASGNEMLSPSIEYETAGAGSWHMWVVTQSAGTNVVRYRQTTNLTDWTWGSWQAVSVEPLQEGRFRPWHLSVRKVGARFVGLLTAYAMREYPTPHDVLMVVGDHKLTFAASTEPVIQRVSALHTTLYQSSMVPIQTAAGLEFDVFYSARNVPTNTWNTYRTRLVPSRMWPFRQAIEAKLTPVDTGWRNISADLRDGWTGVVYIRRVGQVVVLEINSLNSTNATSGTPLRMPTGFRTGITLRRHLSKYPSREQVNADVFSWAANSGSVAIGGYTVGDALRGSFTIITDESPPTTLPGVAV